MDSIDEGAIASRSPVAELEDCLRRCNDLVREFDELKEHLRFRGLNHTGFSGQEFPGLDTHTFAVTHQTRRLQTVLRKAKTDDHGQDALPAAQAGDKGKHSQTELVNCENRWNITKRCRALVSMGTFLPRNPSPGQHGVMPPGPAGTSKKVRGKRMKEKDAVFIDACAENGAKWIRIFTLSEKRLLEEMVRGGYDVDPVSGSYGPRWLIDEAEESDSWSDGEGDDEERATVLSKVQRLICAARANQHNLQPPHVHIILTRIAAGREGDIDKFVERLRGLGRGDVSVTVDCANEGQWLSPAPPLAEVLAAMIYDERDYLTPTLNIDQDIITELVSDMTNTAMEHKAWHVRHVTEQIDRDGPGSPRPLEDMWKVLGSRKLTCTREAAEKFHYLVEEMGTEEEQLRGRLILPRGEAASRSREETLDALQKLCIHPIPRHLQLPVEVVEDDYATNTEVAVAQGKLPAAAIAVAKALGERDRSIFLYGWATGNTTVTCNRTTMKKINRVVAENTNGGGEVGPRMWCPLKNTGNLARRENRSAPRHRARTQEGSPSGSGDRQKQTGASASG